MPQKFHTPFVRQKTRSKHRHAQDEHTTDTTPLDTRQPQSQHESIMQMQRMIGNQATMRTLQRAKQQGKNAEHLPLSLLAKMQGSFGADFSQVKIHNNDARTDGYDAAAYTEGESIHFAPGEYQPETLEGQELIGHELTHVMQQRQGVGHGIQKQSVLNSFNPDPLEAEAHATGRNAAQGRSVRVKGKSSGVQLWPKWMKRAARWLRNQVGGGGGGGGGVNAPIGGPMPTQQPVQQPVQQGPQTMTDDTGEPDVPQTDNYSVEELETHMEAYRTARYYHSTKVENAEKILTDGFDPSKRGKGGADEAQNFNTGNDPKTFFGGDHTTSLYYQRQLGNIPVETLRTFMTPTQIEEMRSDMNDSDNLAYWTPDTIDTTGIIRGNLIDQSQEKLRDIFTIVRMHYPENQQDIDVDEVIARHLECIAKGLTTHEHGGKSGKGKNMRGGERRYQINDRRRKSF